MTKLLDRTNELRKQVINYHRKPNPVQAMQEESFGIVTLNQAINKDPVHLAVFHEISNL
jgi:hypothetical protein